MSATTYQHCYRTLGIRSDCDWEALRLAYRRRVRHCHPDLAPPGDSARSSREEEFKQVVLAYRMLARFHLRYGEMPPPYLVVDNEGPGSEKPVRKPKKRNRENTTDAARRDRTMTFRWIPSRFHQAVVATFVGVICAAALADRAWQDSETVTTAGREGELAVGMDPKSVVDIQGVPNYTKGSVWFYGDSGVIFDQGCVIGWENQPPFPLRTLIRMTYLSGGAGKTESAPAKPGDCAPRVN